MAVIALLEFQRAWGVLGQTAKPIAVEKERFAAAFVARTPTPTPTPAPVRSKAAHLPGGLLQKFQPTVAPTPSLIPLAELGFVVEPRALFALTPTTVTVTVNLKAARERRFRCTLWRLDANGKPTTALGELHDDGRNGDKAEGDGIDTFVFLLTEASAEPVRLQLELAPSATTGATILAVRSVWSEVITLPVQRPVTSLPTPTVPSQTQITNPRLGIKVTVPEGFIYNERVAGLGGPINLRNFVPDVYRDEARPDDELALLKVIPRDGAEIDITGMPQRGRLEDLIADELTGAQIQTRETITVAGGAAQRVVFADVYEGFVCRNVAVYLPRGTVLYKFYISYNGGDALEKRFLAAFEEVLRSVEFTK